MTPETTLGQIVATADLFEAGGGSWPRQRPSWSIPWP